MIRTDDSVARSAAETAVSINPWTNNQAWQGSSSAGFADPQQTAAWSNAQTSSLRTLPNKPQTWGAAAGSPTSISYAEQAKKNVSRGVTPNAILASSHPQQTQHAWGSGSIRVDQHTPWDTTSIPQPGPAHPPSWGQGGAVAGQQQWQQPVMLGNGASQQTGKDGADWQPRQPQRYDPVSDGVSVSGGGGGRNPTHHGSGAGTWGQATADQHFDASQHRISASPWNLQHVPEMGANDMMWQDPNPKYKKIQRDTGTAVWGDPSVQSSAEIRRWKAVEEDDSGTAGPNTITSDEWNSNLPPSTGEYGDSSTGATSAIVEAGWGELSSPANQFASNSTYSQWSMNAAYAMNPPQPWSSPPSASSHPTTASDAKSPELAQIREQTAGAKEGGLQHGWATTRETLNEATSDRLVQYAIARGLIAPSTIQQISRNGRLLTDLHNHLRRLVSKEQELQHLSVSGSQPHNGGRKSEEERLIYEIQNAKSDLLALQRSITNRPQQSGGSLEAISPDGQSSRLQQWKSGAVEKDEISSLLKTTQEQLRINEDDWKSGTLDWSAPGAASERNFSNQHTTAESGSQHADDKRIRGTSSALSNAQSGFFDDGPPAFVPGQKWEWRDPNKVADDPNACPSMHKPNPLLTFSSLAHAYLPGAQQTTPTTQQCNTDEPRADGFPSNAYSKTSSFSPWPEVQNSPNFFAETPSSVWAPKISNFPPAVPPPPTANSQYGMPPPFSAGRMQPPCTPPMFGSSPSSGYWLLFELANINTQQLQNLCMRAGHLLNLAVVGNRIACAKFGDASAEAVLQRIKQEYAADVKIVGEEEFQFMIQNSVRMMPVSVLWPAHPQWNSQLAGGDQGIGAGSTRSSFTPTMQLSGNQ